MFGSVRQRLVLLVLLVSVPLVLATISVVYRLAEIQRDAQHAAMLTGTRALVAAVDVELEKHIAIAKALATSRPLLAGDLRDFREQAIAALSFDPGTWLALADRDGNLLVHTLRPFVVVTAARDEVPVAIDDTAQPSCRELLPLQWFDFTGASLHDMESPAWRKVHHPEHADRVLVGLRHSWQTGEAWEDTFPLRGADGQYCWFLSRALPIRDHAGAVVRWFGTHTDISEQKQTEERQRLLVNELNHRVKNTLAVIQSIAAVTSRSASDAAAFSASFIARIVGIARTHDLLTASHWEGASLRDVLWNELAPYDTDAARRIGLHGEPVHLSPKIAVTLGMVMHEMATNAAKYGALSQADGRVDVTWDVRPDAKGTRLYIEWTETDGPPMPTLARQGFGSRLILQSVERDLEGTVKFDYRPNGLHCVFEFPLTRAQASAQAAE